MRYQCCIFDLDGTLVDSLRSIEHTLNVTLAQFGLPRVPDQKVKEFVGDGYRRLIERALKYGGDDQLVYVDKALIDYRKNFETYCVYEMKAYDGILDLLHWLKAKGIKIAVLSNKLHDRTVENVESVFGKDFFGCVYGERDGVGIKPDPQAMREIMDELGVTPAQCLYFGDTSTDMKTGSAAGVDTVGVTWGFRKRSELAAYQPRYMIDNPMEITKVIIDSIKSNYVG